MRLAAYISIIFAVIPALWSCQSEEPPRQSKPTASASIDCDDEANKDHADCLPESEALPGLGTQLDNFTPLSDDDAIAFFKDTCVSCHDSKEGNVRSFWEIDPGTFNKESFSTSSMAPTVYYALVSRMKDIVGSKPSAMPPHKLKGAQAEELKGLIRWIEVEMPAVITQATTLYGGGDGDGVGVKLNFRCEEPASFREYIRRVTNDAFGREPTLKEIELGAKGPEAPTKSADRQAIVDRLFDNKAWRQEFLDVGLKKFAHKLSGSNDIGPIDKQLTDVQANDLKDEFYQILLANIDQQSFKDILLSQETMVTANTAPLYDCKSGSGWTPCEMKAPRGSYFSTLSYLRSKPSNFLAENNNYGRAALMHYVIRGDVFKAAFNQDGGKENVKALPACLKSKDHRGKKTSAGTFAPHGAAAIPASANLCQSCHIQRQMAAGSILFRPYNSSGQLFGTKFPVAEDFDFAAAITEEMVVKKGGEESPVDEAFLQSLLDGKGEQACVPGEGAQKDKILKGIKDLAAFLIDDGTVLAGGLARHMPRSFSNLDATSEEIIIKVNAAYGSGDGKLIPIFKAYFGSETYACRKR